MNMGPNRPEETIQKPKGSPDIESYLQLVKRYARILPRPTEVYGQPLSIVSQRSGVAASISSTVSD
jgi:hypothetical protein